MMCVHVCVYIYILYVLYSILYCLKGHGHQPEMDLTRHIKETKGRTTFSGAHGDLSWVMQVVAITPWFLVGTL